MAESQATKDLRERLRGFQEQRELMRRAGFFKDNEKPSTTQPEDGVAKEVS